MLLHEAPQFRLTEDNVVCLVYARPMGKKMVSSRISTITDIKARQFDLLNEAQKLDIAKKVAERHIEQIRMGWEIADATFEGDLEPLNDNE